jgi:hypothetical protein
MISMVAFSKSSINNNSTALVIWGENLSSTVSQKRITKSLRGIVELPLHIKSLVVGLLLSDGWIQKNKPHWNARLGFKQSMINFPYFWFVFTLLSHYCSTYPYLTKTQFRGKTHFGIELQTRAYPCFTQLHNLFYVKNVKVVPGSL